MSRPPVGSTGTLAELQVEPGDVVEWRSGTRPKHTIARQKGNKYFSRREYFDNGYPCLSVDTHWTLISRANPDQPALKIEAGKYYRPRDGRKVGPMAVGRDAETPKLWRDMPPQEQAALQQAAHEGKVIEAHDGDEWFMATPRWLADIAYRIRPETKRITVDLMADFKVIGTIDMIDGAFDRASIRLKTDNAEADT